MSGNETNSGKPANVEAGRQSVSDEEAEGIAGLAERERDEVATRDMVAMSGDVEAPAEAGAGVKIRRAFTMKNFLPNPPLPWINQNVVARPVGTHVMVGRVYGIVYSCEDKQTKWNDKLIASIALAGDLQAQDLQGRTTTFDLLFLPMAFASSVARALRGGAHSVEIDVDIGLEATGKTIAYEWTVTSYLSGRAERALRNMANSRRIGGPAPQIAAQLRLAADDRTIDGGPMDTMTPIGDVVDRALAEPVTAARGRNAARG